MSNFIKRLSASSTAAFLILGFFVVPSHGAYGKTNDIETNTTTTANRTTTIPTAKNTQEDREQKYSKYYNQKIQWVPCTEEVKGVDCGTISVPTDWSNPDDDSIKLAFSIRRALRENKKKGHIVVNPGGPGASAYSGVLKYKDFIKKKLRKYYDIVGVDPRGIGYSAGLNCFDTYKEEMQFVNRSTLLNNVKTEGSKKAGYIKSAQDFFNNCGNKKLAANMGTVDVARDFDVLRAALGDEKLNFYGASYGTHIGAYYADLFPENVGRLVLDGVITFYGGYEEIVRLQKIAYDQALVPFLEYCNNKRDEECLFDRGSIEEIRSHIKNKQIELDNSPLIIPARKTGGVDREFTASTLLSLIVSVLASGDLGIYDMFIKAYNTFEKDDDPFPLLEMSDQINDIDTATGNSLIPLEERGFNPGQTAGAVCSIFTNQLEKEFTFEDYEKLESSIGIFSLDMFGSVFPMCIGWPENTNNKRLSSERFVAKGSDPILVLGGTGDSQTPIQWAHDLNNSLENSRLVIFDGRGHIAYGRTSRCVNGSVHQYFLKGKLPEDNLLCGYDPVKKEKKKNRTKREKRSK